MNRGRRAKDAEVAEVTVDMQTLKSGSETEDWYHLTGVTPIGKHFLRQQSALYALPNCVYIAYVNGFANEYCYEYF